MIEFKLNEKEETAAKAYMEKHRHPDINKGASGGHVFFCFNHTSI